MQKHIDIVTRGGGGWRFELNEVKLDEERAFLVIESALRSRGIII